jgi:hypothetical protein
MTAMGSSLTGTVRPPSAVTCFAPQRPSGLGRARPNSANRSAAVLAVSASSRFPAPTGSLGRSNVAAQLARSGRVVTISFVGASAGSGPCTADYAVDQLASRTAVAVSVRETRRETGACTDVGYVRHQRITLTSPLGNRVLVDARSKGPVATAP